MFEGPDYPKALDESQFETWLEKGRSSPMPYAYLLIVWDELEERYIPIYVEDRAGISGYSKYGTSPDLQSMVAAYDLYSESRVG